MRFNQPIRAVPLSSHCSSAWAGTCAWLNRIERSGSIPQATSAAVISSVAACSSAGTCGMRDRVEVGEEEQALAAFLHRVLHADPVADGAQVIAEVELARWAGYRKRRAWLQTFMNGIRIGRVRDRADGAAGGIQREKARRLAPSPGQPGPRRRGHDASRRRRTVPSARAAYHNSRMRGKGRRRLRTRCWSRFRASRACAGAIARRGPCRARRATRPTTKNTAMPSPTSAASDQARSNSARRRSGRPSAAWHTTAPRPSPPSPRVGARPSARA